MDSHVGVYVGTFDPVHAGHIAFALQALQEARLEMVYFLPERMPRHKRPIEHYGHRVAMLERALRPYQKLQLIETADKRFSFTQTIPRLQANLQGDRFTFLCTAASFVGLFEGRSGAIKPHSCIVSVANKDELGAITEICALSGQSLRNIMFVDALWPAVATEYVQAALRSQTHAPGVLPSVARYARSEWLYAALPTLRHR